MRTFKCVCTNQPTLFFENQFCEACGRRVGITDDFEYVEPFEPDSKTGHYRPCRGKGHYKPCYNNEHYQACNGMVEIDVGGKKKQGEMSDYCFACRFTKMIPDLSVPAHLPLWRKMEVAKRRALYTLKSLPLSLGTKQQKGRGGLELNFVADRSANDHFRTPLAGQPPALTGHDNGTITINLAEADDVSRSEMRLQMHEYYRTLLGHFRHELGHYFFDQLILPSAENTRLFKSLFGDSDADYSLALDKHYRDGPPVDWQDYFVSAYATMHPWEDWAETWAHYLHIIDTLDTAHHAGIFFDADSSDVKSPADLSMPQANQFYGQSSFARILKTWMAFSTVLNSLNRSMGIADAYPFVIKEPVQKKLSFVHHCIHGKLKQWMQSEAA